MILAVGPCICRKITPVTTHPKAHDRARRRGRRKIGIVVNAGMVARARKREIVNDAKLRIKNDGQRQNT